MADEPALIVGLDDESVVGQAPTTGRCRCCRHKLLDPVSLAYGMGPDCRKRLGTTPQACTAQRPAVEDTAMDRPISWRKP
ncbi:DUF6011 domain-containing protein [Nonomuraea thailandensis]